ncbi:MAG: ribosome biogenesis GTPase Der [Hyphomicrobium sp.]|uniref:ribosome biogenesis GTPase Der n=1 Tax=Hyphomicrobium sp. TaxID=82 RepID=UPI003D1372B2
MTPKIAIVGRPNVGKSTLFNRLTGTRDALVSDLPGLTRDRKEGAAELGGHPITIIDTAGLEVAAKGSIADRMRLQTEAAISLADLVLFVIDARDGVTATDQTFARTVRASGRPVVLIANKCEGRSSDEGFYEAFKLGLGEPVAISAEHGLGLGDLERDALAALGLKPKQRPKRRDDASDDDEAPAETSQRPLRVAIVGRPNAGKSTLVNAILGEDRMIVGPEPGLTRDSVASDIDWQGHAIRLFDTAGLRRKAKVTETAEKLSTGDALRAIRFAEVVVLLLDAERGIEHQDLTIAELVTEEGRALVIALNKWDRIEAKDSTLRALREKIAEGLAQVPGVAVIPISAASEKGLDKLLRAVITAAEIWNRRVPTPALNRWLGEALARHAPPAPSGRRLKIRYMTQPSTRPPTFVAFCSRPDALPQAYQKYLTNSLREAFDLPGVPIRLNLRGGDNPFAPKKRRS